MKNFLMAILLSVPALAFGQAGLWHDAESTGHGIQINKDTGFGHAVTWYLYRKDGSSAFLTVGETCKDFPCVVTLHEPKAGFMGRGEFDLGEPVGMLELALTETGKLDVDYNLSVWLGDECSNITAGGLLFRGCVGSFEMEFLAE